MKLLAALLVLLTAQLTHAQDSETWREYSPEPAPTAEPEPTPGPPPQWRRKWTRTDLLRVRAELAARRAELLRQAKRDGVPLHTAPRPRVYGNAGSPRMVGFEVLTLFQDDVGFRRFSRQDANQRFGVFASYDLLTLAPKLIAGVELGGGFEHNEARGLLGAPDTTDLYSQTFHAGIDLRWDVLNFLAPTLRAWGGVSLFQLDLGGTGRNYQTARATSGFGALGAGFLLHTPPRTFESRGGSFSSFGVGLWVEGGYALRSPVDFALRSPENPRGIRVIDADLGRLSLSGPYVRVALVVRF